MNLGFTMANEQKQITIQQLEEKIFLQEHVRVIFRIHQNHLVPDYAFEYIVGDGNFYAKLQDRIEKSYPNISFMAIDGYGMPIERRGRKLTEIRETYIKANNKYS